MDETNNFTLMTWTPQGNSLTPIATLTFAQIGTRPDHPVYGAHNIGVVLTQAIQLDTSTGLLAMIGVDFKTVKNSLYLIDPQDGEGTQLVLHQRLLAH